MKYRFKITGYGRYLPPKIETSAETAKLINKSRDWIISKTGVESRRISEIDVDQMGAIAAKQAIGEKKKPDLIINASGVPKQTIPDTSIFIQKELGYDKIPCFSVHSTCLSFITGLNIAGSFFKSDTYKRILIVSSDRGTRGRNFNQPESAALLGDAAAAVYLERTKEDRGLLDYCMSSFPAGSDLTEVRGGGTNLHPQDSITKDDDNLFSMKGPHIFKFTLPKVYRMIQLILKSNNYSINDIDVLVPHQASNKAIRAYTKFGQFPEEKIINIISNTGNCVAASLPLALTYANDKYNFKGDKIVFLVGTGAGLSIASAILKI
tara:strand:- start:3586 stop:4551 length:966 start_codon:yes stop_codon:yes gene_type:complete